MSTGDDRQELDEFFALLRAAPAPFFGVWLDEPDGSGLTSMASVATGSPAWAGSVMDACLAELLRGTPTVHDIFRQDLAATRCLKSMVSGDFAAAVHVTAAGALARLVAKKNCDLAEHAARLLQQLAAVELPPIVHLLARRLLTAFEGKFSGAGRTALVGLFWLRMLCPLLLRLGAGTAASKPGRSARIVDFVKLLQARANEVVGSGGRWQELDDVLDSLLSGSDVWPPRTPPEVTVRPFLVWLAGHALPLGRTLKLDKQLFDSFTGNLAALRSWQPATVAVVEVDPAAKAVKSTSMPGLARMIFVRPSTLSKSASNSSDDLLDEPRTPRSLAPRLQLGDDPLDEPRMPRSLAPRLQLGAFCSLDVTPVRTDGVELPAVFAGFKASRAEIETWTTADVVRWLINCQLPELVAPFEAVGVFGKHLFDLHRRSPVFVDFNVKIGVVHQFLAAQRSLLRSAMPLFDNAQFCSPEEQVLAMKELIVRMASRLNQDKNPK